jgi:hypothetical protein
VEKIRESIGPVIGVIFIITVKRNFAEQCVKYRMGTEACLSASWAATVGASVAGRRRGTKSAHPGTEACELSRLSMLVVELVVLGVGRDPGMSRAHTM